MNGIDKITDRIAADAQLEIDALNAETSRKCAEITEKYEKTASEEYTKIINQGKQDAKSRLERMNSASQLEARKRILAEKQAIVATAFDRAVSVLRALPDDKYSALLAKLCCNASRTGSEQILMSADDREKFGSTICEMANRYLASNGRAANLSLSELTRPTSGGVILVDGKIEINCTFEVLVNEYKDELTGEAAKILFD